MFLRFIVVKVGDPFFRFCSPKEWWSNGAIDMYSSVFGVVSLMYSFLDVPARNYAESWLALACITIWRTAVSTAYFIHGSGTWEPSRNILFLHQISCAYQIWPKFACWYRLFDDRRFYLRKRPKQASDTLLIREVCWVLSLVSEIFLEPKVTCRQGRKGKIPSLFRPLKSF